MVTANKVMQSILALAIVGTLALLPPAAVTNAQQPYPGTTLFSYQCNAAGIAFYNQSTPVFQVSSQQIAAPLAAAISTLQNQPIVIGSEIGLWALKSDELQMHLNEDPDATKLVLPSSVCGEITHTTARSSAQALAYVQITGPGEGFAFAQVSSNGSVIAYVRVLGAGQAGAYAGSATPLTPPAHRSCVNSHIVRQGETLFRIALQNGTTVHVLTTINHLHNPNLIYVGQRICLP
jgi:LysM repeat protein